MTRILALALFLTACSEAHVPPAVDGGGGDSGPPLTAQRACGLVLDAWTAGCDEPLAVEECPYTGPADANAVAACVELLESSAGCDGMRAALAGCT